METRSRVCLTSFMIFVAFLLGSGINGNKKTSKNLASKFKVAFLLGSGINGNSTSDTAPRRVRLSLSY